MSDNNKKLKSLRIDEEIYNKLTSIKNKVSYDEDKNLTFSETVEYIINKINKELK